MKKQIVQLIDKVRKMEDSLKEDKQDNSLDMGVISSLEGSLNNEYFTLDLKEMGLSRVKIALCKLQNQIQVIEQDPSLKDKGRAANKKPNNIFKEDRRGFSSRPFKGGTTPGGRSLSSFARCVSTSTPEAGGRSTRNSGRDKDSERNHPASRVDSLPSPKPASVKAKVDPSLKDKGRTATEQPNNIFKGVRRDQWGLSSFAPDKGYRPKSSLRTKYKIFNPLKQLVGEHRESLVSDALKELEPAKHPEILVPDAVKRPVRRQKPASDIFSKSFFHLISSNKRLTSYIDPSEKKLRQPKGRGYIGDRKYFPAVSTEWKNTIYVFNRNALYKNLPAV